MTSKEFISLIERCIGKNGLGSYVSTDKYEKLKPFLEEELCIKLPSDKPYNQTYIDLWRYVNGKLGERASSNVQVKSGKQNSNTESTVIIPEKKGKTVIPVSLKVAKKLNEISKKIESDNSKLEDCLYEIQNAEPTIDIGSYLGVIVKKSDVEASIYEVYSSLCDYIVKCGDAIRASNGNVSNILELIQLLTAAEVDLYHLMDNQAIESNELRILIKEWCKKHGIHDDEVDKLLESSFQRAYTLRDRINDLRKDFYEKIDKNNEQIRELQSHYSDYQAKIQEATDSAILSLRASAEKKMHDIDNQFIEKQKELQKSFDIFSSNANKEIERVEALKRSLDDKNKEFSEKVTLYFSKIDQKEKSIEQLSFKKTEELLSVAREVTEKGNMVEKKANDRLNSLEQNNQTFQSKMQADFKNNKEVIDNELTRIKESQEWFKKELNKNLEEKVQGFADLYKQFVTDQTTIIDKLEHKVSTYKVVAIIAGVVSVASIVIGLLV